MSSLPQHIPPQTASLGKADASGNVTIDVTWYLLLYNLCNQILSPPNGSVVASPLDLLSIEGEDTVEIPTGSFSDAASSSVDKDATAADIAQLRLMLQGIQSLVADILDSAGVSLWGISGLGAGIATFLQTPSSANLAAALTDETGSGLAVFSTSPTLVTPALGVATATALTVNLAPSDNLTIASSYGCLVPDFYEIANTYYVDVADKGVLQIE